jgi:hypothetical protein
MRLTVDPMPQYVLLSLVSSPGFASPKPAASLLAPLEIMSGQVAAPGPPAAAIAGPAYFTVPAARANHCISLKGVIHFACNRLVSK